MMDDAVGVDNTNRHTIFYRLSERINKAFIAFQCKSIQIVLKMITIECIEILNGVEIKQINACTHINHNLF